jgi:DNA-binding protein HU-beta
MNKAQLIEKVSQLTQSTKQQSEEILDATLAVIQRTVSKGDEVKLVGFGTFCRTDRKARPGRNPKTGESVQIPEARVPRFKPGKDFKDHVK